MWWRPRLSCCAVKVNKKRHGSTLRLRWLLSEGKAEKKEKVEILTWAQGGTLGSGGRERAVMGTWAVMPAVLGKPKAGLWVALAPEKG